MRVSCYPPKGVAAQLMYEDSSGQSLAIYIQAGEGGEIAFRFGEPETPRHLPGLIKDFASPSRPHRPRAPLPIAETIYRALSRDSGNISG
jgi:hypothetical protein